MTTYNPSAIRAQIKALLQTVTELAVVYDYRSAVLSGYPAVIFDMTNEEGTMLDDSNNVRVLTFTIWIICELPVKGEDLAKTILDDATKAVINILEKKSNDTLSGTVDWVMPALGQRSEVQTPSGNTIYQEVRLRCNVASTIL
jgi:hypothetical protein